MKRISSMTPISSTRDRGLTATREVLLPGGSDHSLRTLLYNLFTIGNRLEEVRRYLGAGIGISGPQFTLLMAIRELEGEHGVSVGKLASYLHVAGTFDFVWSLPVPRKPMTCQMSVICAWLFGKSKVRRTVPPSARRIGAPSGPHSTMCAPNQLALWLPLAKFQVPVSR